MMNSERKFWEKRILHTPAITRLFNQMFNCHECFMTNQSFSDSSCSTASVDSKESVGSCVFLIQLMFFFRVFVYC